MWVSSGAQSKARLPVLQASGGRWKTRPPEGTVCLGCAVRLTGQIAPAVPREGTEQTTPTLPRLISCACGSGSASERGEKAHTETVMGLLSARVCWASLAAKNARALDFGLRGCDSALGASSPGSAKDARYSTIPPVRKNQSKSVRKHTSSSAHAPSCRPSPALPAMTWAPPTFASGSSAGSSLQASPGGWGRQSKCRQPATSLASELIVGPPAPPRAGWKRCTPAQRTPAHSVARGVPGATMSPDRTDSAQLASSSKLAQDPCRTQTNEDPSGKHLPGALARVTTTSPPSSARIGFGSFSTSPSSTDVCSGPTPRSKRPWPLETA
mmetsp:Transcript_141234/g.393614  ORF Transcript_141234/g.393614 Transcript_141234/m.393614 type:complete len:326 (+) Transcript_141234:2234-3211(+)